MRPQHLAIAALAFVAGCARAPASPQSSQPAIEITIRSPAAPPPEVLGTQPPEWSLTDWVNGDGVTLSELRGQVVLVRWFTGDWCDDCSATAPALRHFYETYKDLGFAVVGMFHNSDASSLADVEKIVKQKYQYAFPVAIDRKTETRKAWCQGNDDWATSVTFLLDRRGTIRHVHPGGRYVDGDFEYDTIERTILDLLVEPSEDNAP